MATLTERTPQPGRNARPFWRRHFFKLTLLPLGALIVLWFFVIQPHTSKTVNEALPTAAPLNTAATAVPATSALAATAQAPAVGQAQPAPTSAPAATGPVALKSGNFVKVEDSGSGKATIFKQADGTYLLRFDNLDVTNGPDLRVRLLGPNGANLDLGGLKGTKGNQNYALPADFDPAKYDAADIWCRAFNVQFVKAALS
ncbi:MAG: DM13 domain-containing protein [Thermomicrobia bacterium]|nr:DM13 domain-containing protein [Thermomicrobia bacterium]